VHILCFDFVMVRIRECFYMQLLEKILNAYINIFAQKIFAANILVIIMSGKRARDCCNTSSMR